MVRHIQTIWLHTQVWYNWHINVLILAVWSDTFKPYDYILRCGIIDTSTCWSWQYGQTHSNHMITYSGVVKLAHQHVDPGSMVRHIQTIWLHTQVWYNGHINMLVLAVWSDTFKPYDYILRCGIMGTSICWSWLYGQTHSNHMITYSGVV